MVRNVKVCEIKYRCRKVERLGGRSHDDDVERCPRRSVFWECMYKYRSRRRGFGD